MAIVLPGDLDVFFDAEGFGEAIKINNVPGFVGIWDRPGGEIEAPNGRFVVTTNIIQLQACSVPATAGVSIMIERTGETFVIVGAPQLNRDGTIWICEMDPA